MKLEAEGNTFSDRNEALLSAIFHIVLVIASHGKKEIFDTLRKEAIETESIKPRKRKECSGRERSQILRNSFAADIKRAKLNAKKKEEEKK